MLSDKQNQQAYYKFLKAMRLTYTRAKKVRLYRYICTVVLALIAPFMFVFLPQHLSIIGVIGGILALLSFLVRFYENGLIKKAALIQEIFDTDLYELEWNEYVCGVKKIPYEFINCIVRKYNDEELELEFKGWYEGIENIKKPLSVLLCQRQNLVWDYRLRDVYAYWIIAILVINFVVGLVLFTIFKQTLLCYFLGLFLPSLSMYLLGLEEAINHLKISKNKKRIEQMILKIIKDTTLEISLLKLRHIQDAIFNERQKSPLIPDKIYNRLKKKYSLSTTASIQDLLKFRN